MVWEAHRILPESFLYEDSLSCFLPALIPDYLAHSDVKQKMQPLCGFTDTVQWAFLLTHPCLTTHRKPTVWLHPPQRMQKREGNFPLPHPDTKHTNTETKKDKLEGSHLFYTVLAVNVLQWFVTPTIQAKNAILHKTSFTSDTSCKFGAPETTLTSDQLAINLKDPY